MTSKKQLALVMPVFNEEACITESVSEWIETLARAKIDFEFFVLDDGSTDSTSDKLAEFKTTENLTVLRWKNSGHGPTILRGYLLASGCAEWVFQTDSDGEIGSCHFTELWERRSGYHAIMGVRTGRRQEFMRAAISGISRMSVRYLYGSGVLDVNVPYRMIRSEILEPIIRKIPADSFAPNVIISGLLALRKAKILNVPVPCIGRKKGSTSLTNFKLLSGVIRSFSQLASLRFRIAG